MQNKIYQGIKTLEKLDEYLLGVNINERALTHKLAVYYEALFPKWDVDCEYNKNGHGPKDVDFDPRNLLNRMLRILRDEDFAAARDIMGNFTHSEVNNREIISLAEQLNDPELEYDAEQELWYFILKLIDGTTIRKSIIPDIIIHKRGKRDNYIAIEVKKNYGLGSPSVASRIYDILKLEALIQDKSYNYKYGYFITLPVLDAYYTYTGYSIMSDVYEPRIFTVDPSY